MDVNTIAGTAMMMQAARAQDSISLSLVKVVSDQQKQMADMIAQSAAQAGSQIAASQNYSFSVYA